MSETISRRGMLGAGAGGLLLLKPQTAFTYQANNTVDVGIVGCGGRGHYVGAFFVEFGAKVVALHDPIPSQAEKAQAKFGVNATRVYTGLDGYQDLANSQLDAVLVMSPPFFHAQQVRAAVNAGKHVYLAKPVAPDTAGCLSILEDGRKLEGKRSFWVDFQTRSRPVYQEAVDRVKRGDIGPIVVGQMYYHANYPGVGDATGLDARSARLRRWLGDRVLSGDIIVEQHIHVIDVGNWFAGSHPVKARGTYGRKVRTNGDASDYFLVTYWYPSDLQIEHSSVQFTKGYADLCVRMFGPNGTADTHYGGTVRITGDKAWMGAEKDDTFKGGAVTNAQRFVESIRTGKLIQNVPQGVESTLTAILGRNAAYRGEELTWEQLLREREAYTFA